MSDLPLVQQATREAVGPVGSIESIGPIIEARFWKKVSKHPTGCWHWIGAAKPKGYGNFWVNGKCYNSHRIAFILTHGPISDDHVVMHSCDNPRCVNPAHLAAGTHTDNRIDMFSKGRGVIGSIHHRSKLDEAQVKEIRELYKSGDYFQREIGEKYGVSQTLVGSIVRRKHWRHIA